MGKLIKNHWARLIILTAAACTSSPTPPTPSITQSLTSPNRPNRRLNQRLLLAETLLGLPDHEPRPRRPAHPDPSDHQPPPRSARPLLGMASTPLHHRRHLHPLAQQPPRHLHLIQPHIPNHHKPSVRAQAHHLQRLTPESAELVDDGSRGDASQHRSQTVHLSAEQFGGVAAVPGDERGALLYHRHGRLFLGFQ